MTQAIRFLVGSAVVYAALAACSGSGRDWGTDPEALAGAGGVPGAGGAALATGGGNAPDAGTDGATVGPDVVAVGSADSGALDALIDPVPDAHAAGAGGQAGGSSGAAGQVTGGSAGTSGAAGGASCVVCECDCPEPMPYVPPEPEVVTVACVTGLPGSGPYPFAELLLPGRTEVELAGVVSILHGTERINLAPDGYLDIVGHTYIKAGAVVRGCTSTSQTVTFIIPAL
ncbi:MAG TPA: hypothetical protein VM487_02400, partial [Phycisphaerae bacterium]|nr:hypothetical protein [Phycisphaerae bacterium]